MLRRQNNIKKLGDLKTDAFKRYRCKCEDKWADNLNLMVIMGIVLVLMETMVSTGMWWILLVNCSILLEKCPKHTTKMNFVMVLLGKANGL